MRDIGKTRGGVHRFSLVKTASAFPGLNHMIIINPQSFDFDITIDNQFAPLRAISTPWGIPRVHVRTIIVIMSQPLSRAFSGLAAKVHHSSNTV